MINLKSHHSHSSFLLPKTTPSQMLMRLLLQLPLLRTPTPLLAPYACSATSVSPSSSSSSPVLHLSTSPVSDIDDFGKVSDSVTVEMSMTSSNVGCKDEHGATINGEPVRKRIANLNPIFRHLGIKKGLVQPCDTPTNCSLSEGKNKLANVDSIQKVAKSCLKQPEPAPAGVSGREKETPLPSTSSRCTSMTERHHQSRSPDRDHKFSEESFLQDDDFLVDIESTRMLEEHSLPTGFGNQKVLRPRKSKATPYDLKRGAVTSVIRNSKNNIRFFTIEPFDICQCQTEEFVLSQQSESEDIVFLRSPVDHMEDVVEANDMDQMSEGPRQQLLRPGMVLLKKYLTHNEQVSIVRKCRDLGLGPGGFYQPRYKDGAKLRLHMMCLGLDWDPQTKKYLRRRRIDRAEPPDIPSKFHLLVDRAMQDSHALIRRNSKLHKAEEILPLMSPDICIVNFYTETGRLGLHQDRDESLESLTKGLPVVSFSVGDSAEFLYGDRRDPNKANKVVLESGDVLIFGGESRHVFHGVASIIPDSAPRSLLEETGLSPGRLNLTFRKY